MVRKRKCIIGILLVLCMVILQVPFAYLHKELDQLQLQTMNHMDQFHIQWNGNGDDANGTINGDSHLRFSMMQHLLILQLIQKKDIV